MSETGWKPNPELYERLSKPYETQEAAGAALTRFSEGMAKLREECGIAEVLIVAGAYSKEEGGRAGLCQTFQCFGSHGVLPTLLDTARRQTASTLAEHHERMAAEYRAIAEVGEGYEQPTTEKGTAP